MRLAKKLSFSNQKGFTLVELMVVLAIMGFVAAAIYGFFGYTQKSYAHAEANSIVSQDATLFFTQIEKEIRNATEPNKNTKAVNVSDDGQQINIYQYDGSKYERICYRRNPNNNLLLEKGSVSVTSQASGNNPEYGTINNWKTISSYLLPGNAALFSDRNPSDTASSRRLIDITLSLKHPKTNTALNIQSSVMNRSGLSTQSIEEGSGPFSAYIPVTGIEFVEVPTTFPKAGATKTIMAKVIPSNATNKNLVWSEQIHAFIWLRFPEYSLAYDDGTGSITEGLLEGVSDRFGYWDTMTTRSGSGVLIKAEKYETLGLPSWFLNLFGNLAPDPRQAIIRVSSPDGPAAQIVIEQHRDS